MKNLYALNVPKDNWMFDMGDVETEAMLMADNWNTALDTHIEGFYVNSADDWVSLDNSWELKHFGTEDTTGDPQWVATSFNTLMDFIKNNDGDAFRGGIDTYLDVDAAIDYMLYMYAIYMRDNSAKNILWATYDGVKWFPSVYDQDGTFGMVWDGIRSASITGMLPSVNAATGIVDDQIVDNNSTILWNKLLNLFTERVVERYRELRADALSEENILAHFAAFAAEVPDGIYEADRLAWKTEYESYVQGKYAQYGYDFSSWSWYGFGYEYIADWVPARLAKMDAAIDKIADVCLGE